MKACQKLTFRPTNMSSPYEFNIVHKAANSYLIPQHTRLYVKLKVVRENGTNIVADDNVSVVNMLATSLWKTIEVEIGGKPISQLQNEYAHYKAYFETALTYGQDARSSHLATYGFAMDSADQFDNCAMIQNTNNGFTQRKELIAGSRWCEFKTPLHCDFLQSERSFPSGMDFRLKLTKENDNFLLLSNTMPDVRSFKIVIETLKLTCHFVEMHDDLVHQHQLLKEKTPAQIFVNKTCLKTHTYPANMVDLRIDELFVGANLPKMIAITLVHQDSFLGTINRNPYNFQHFNLKSACIKVNGHQIPVELYTPDFPNRLFMDMYRDLFDNTGILTNDFGNTLTPSLFNGGMFIMAFDRSPDLCNGFHYHPKVIGTINLELTLNQAVNHSIVLLAFGVYNTVALIDKYGNVEMQM